MNALPPASTVGATNTPTPRPPTSTASVPNTPTPLWAAVPPGAERAGTGTVTRKTTSANVTQPSNTGEHR
jgi:hypothetical protein